MTGRAERRKSPHASPRAAVARHHHDRSGLLPRVARRPGGSDPYLIVGPEAAALDSVVAATAARDEAAIVEAALEHGPTLVATGRADVLAAALAEVPARRRASDVGLLAIDALRRRADGDFPGAVESARTAIAAAEHTGAHLQPSRVRRRTEADLLLLELWFSRHGWDGSGRALDAADRCVASGALLADHPELSLARRSWLATEMGAASLWAGRTADATVWSEHGVEFARAGGHARFLGAALAYRSLVEMLDGSLLAASATAQESLAAVADLPGPAPRGLVRAQLTAAWVAHLRIDDDRAAQLLGLVDGATADELDPTVRVASSALAGRLALARGDVDGAWGHLTGAAVDRPDLPPVLRREVHLARAGVAVARQDGAAVAHERDAMGRAGLAQERDLLDGVVHALDGDPDGALRVIGDLLRDPDVSASNGVAAAACRVAVLLSGADARATQEGVRDLLGRVATTGADRWLLVGALAGAPFVRAVEEEAQGPAAHPFAASALARLGAAAHGAPHAPWLDDACAALRDGTSAPLLTEREGAVLELLAEGRSYADIGSSLYISRNTVKSHVTAIYRKFGVDRAVQAALVARRYGMIRNTGEVGSADR